MRRCGITALLCSLLIMGAACAKKDAEKETQEKPPKPVQIGQVELGTIKRILTAPGSIVPQQDVWVSAEVGGRVLFRHVLEGQRVFVEPGADPEQSTTNRIASIDPADYKRLLSQAEATLKVAEASLTQYTATQKRLTDEVERKRPLHEQKIISDNTWDDLVTRKEETDALVTLYQARVEEATQAVEIVRSNVAKTTVRSPIEDAFVAEVMFEAGEYVTPGQRLIRLVNLDTMWVDVEVGESRLAEIKRGRDATFRVPAYPADEFTGTIEVISPAGDPMSRNFLVRLSVKNPEHRLKAGMFAIVQIPVNTRHEVTVVPMSAVQQKGKFRSIFLVEGDTVRKRAVSLGTQSGNVIEVLDEDLKLGVPIVTAGVETLNDGDRVTRIEPTTGATE